jgi:hypothetical protein
VWVKVLRIIKVVGLEVVVPFAVVERERSGPGLE